MPIYKFVIQFTRHNHKSNYYLNEAHALGFHTLRKIIVQDLYFIEGQLSQEGLQQLALKLLTDPVTETATWAELPSPLSPPEPSPALAPGASVDQTQGKPDSVILEVALRPGVTDPVAEQIVRAAHELGIDGVIARQRASVLF